MFWNFVIGVASFLLQLLLTPKPQNAKPASLEDFSAPVAEEGLEIPDIFGTELLNAPNVVWYGDLGIEDIKGARRYGFFGPRQVIGHKYSMGMHMVLCAGPIDDIQQIRVGDKIAFEGSIEGGTISIDEPELFGGEQREGGIVGDVDIAMGGPAQLQNDYLLSVQTAPVPAYRGVVSAILRQPYLGTNTYLKPWEFIGQRIYLQPGGSAQWYPETAGIYRGGAPRYYDVPGTTFTYKTNPNNRSHMVDMGDTTFARIGSGGTTIEIYNLLSGTLVATTALGYDAFALIASKPTSEFLVLGTDGDLRSYNALTGAHNDTAAGIGAMTGGINTFGSMTIREVDGTTFLMVATAVHVHCFSKDSFWIKLYSQFRGFYFGGIFTSMTMSDTRLYARHGDGHISIYSWNELGISGRYLAPKGTYSPAIGFGVGEVLPDYVGLQYIDEFDCVILVVYGGHIYRLSADMLTQEDHLLNSISWTASALSRYPTSNNLISGPNRITFYAPSQDHDDPNSIWEFQIEPLQLLERYPYTLWPGISEFSIDETSMAATSAHAIMIEYGRQGSPAYTQHVYFLDSVLDMNPAHIIRECIIKRMGYTTADIDEDSFTDAADTLYAEDFGLTFKWAREEEIGEFINIVLAHIDAYCYISRTTGKFVLKLIRNDYILGDLPIFDEDDVREWIEVEHRQPEEAKNSVIVKYTNRLDRYKEASHQVDNIAQIEQNNGIRLSATRFYPGISTGNLAVRVARRDVKSLGVGIISGSLKGKRRFDSLNPGDPFRLISTRHKLAGEVMRVADMKFGDGRNNAITIKFIQDVFHLSDSELVSTVPSNWENPQNPPEAVSPRLIWEMPYKQLVDYVGASEANSLLTNPDFGAIEVAGGKPTGDSIEAVISVKKNSGSYVDRDVMTFTATGFLDTDIDAQSISITIENASQSGLIEVGMLAVLNGNDRDLMEIIRIDNIASLTMTISRGLLDTVPKSHLAGSEFILFEGFTQSDAESYTSTDTVSVKLKTTTSAGTLSATLAPVNTVDMDSRAIRPFPPANCQVNSIGYGPVDLSGLNPIPTDWARRNRTITSSISDWNDADVATVESGTTTTIRLLDADGISVFEYTGVTGTTQDINPAYFGSTVSGFIEFDSERDSYNAWQTYRIAVVFTSGILLEGDAQSGTDKLILEGDEAPGDVLLEGSL